MSPPRELSADFYLGFLKSANSIENINWESNLLADENGPQTLDPLSYLDILLSYLDILSIFYTYTFIDIS